MIIDERFHPNTNGIWKLHVAMCGGQRSRAAEEAGLDGVLHHRGKQKRCRLPIPLPASHYACVALLVPILLPPPPTSDPVSSPVRFSLLYWDPMQTAEAPASSAHHLFPSPLFFHHLHSSLCQIPSGWCSWFPAGDRVRNGTSCRTHFSLAW